MDDQVRQRCYQCFRPQALCFCDAVPRIDNRTDVLILQHVRERFHAFNTARIVRQALKRCHLIVDHNRNFGKYSLPLQHNAGLLYPALDAPLLNELPPSRRPGQLVILDGTWHQAKTIYRDLPAVRELPCYRLAPSSPGQYRIRREPNAHSLSTLEATVQALRALEPDTLGLNALSAAFAEMVDRQLAHPASGTAWRKKKRRESHLRDIPRKLLRRPEQIVVAYGEATPGRPGLSASAPTPVNWLARRLVSGETFSCQLRQQPPLSSTDLKHMRLTSSDLDQAVPNEVFCRRWHDFLRGGDILVVYHHRTYQLLRPIQARRPKCLVLKSIFGQWRNDFRGVEELAAAEQLSPPSCAENCRAAERLELAVALVQHLRQRV